MWWRKRVMVEQARELPRSLRVSAMLALWASVLPMLLSLPPTVAAPIWLLPGASGVLALYRPIGKLVLLAITVVCAVAIVALQAGEGDIRHTGLGILVAAILMKASEMRTTRDGYSTVGFVLIGPFVAFVMEMGGAWATVSAAVSLAMAFSLAGMMCEWQDRRAYHSWGFHLRRVVVLAAMAAPLAAAAFWLVPRLDSPLWGIRAPEQATTGMGDTMAPGDVGNLMKNPATAFRVEFHGGRPDQSQMYWKGLTLGRFDGRTWSQATPAAGFPPGRPGPGTGTAWRYDITLEPTGDRHLVVLDALAFGAPAGTRLREDGTLVSMEPVDRPRRLEGMVSRAPANDPNASLAPDQVRDLTALPEGYNPRALALAGQWRQRGLTDAQIVRTALDMFAQEFSYSLRPPLLGRNSVDEFLFDTRMGYCEHFSSSMAVLMRAAGIPTRVVVGYQGGIANEYGHWWRVRQADAHAWNEVWLEGRGWVRVDPTFALGPQVTASEGQEMSVLVRLGGNGNMADWVRFQWGSMFQDFDAYRQRELMRQLGLGNLHPALAGALAGLALALVFLAIVLAMMRERRERAAPAMRAWHKLLVRLERAGYAPARHETPLALARRVAGLMEDPATGRELEAAAAAFCRWRYQDLDAPDLARRLDKLAVPRLRAGKGAKGAKGK